jgi:hemerythrin-like domain-containing protein
MARARKKIAQRFLRRAEKFFAVLPARLPPKLAERLTDRWNVLKEVLLMSQQDAIRMLDRQHDEIAELFHRLRTNRGDPRRQTFLELAQALSEHTTIEEQIFYPAVRARRTADILEQSLEEHSQIKRTLGDLIDLEPSDNAFDARLSALEHAVTEHIARERHELFPRVKRVFSHVELEELANQMEALLGEMVAEDKMEEEPTAPVTH